jgi:hypothetical protein
MKKRKPRMTMISVDPGGRDLVVRLNRPGDDPLFSLHGENGESVEANRIEIGAAYQRSGKPLKVLTNAPADPAEITTDPNQILATYDLVIAVDTNTKVIDGTSVTVAVSIAVRGIEIEHPRIAFWLSPPSGFEFHDATEPPERVGWWKTINDVLAWSAARGPGGSVALIVDSDLDKHRALMAREEPVVRGFYLPDNFRIIYGSVDAGTSDYIANCALQDCDKTAKKAIQRIADSPFIGPYIVPQGAPYSRYAFWSPVP